VIWHTLEKNGGIVNGETGMKSDILIQIPNGPKTDQCSSGKEDEMEE
jgi:ATP-dependent Clp protease ATP-binding subunit ClpB